MSSLQLVALASRLFALWLLIMALRQSMLTGFLTAQISLANWQLLLLPLPAALAGVLLWCCPQWVAGKLVPRTEHDHLIRMPARQVAALASATFGLWAVVLAAPDVIVAIEVLVTPGRRAGLSTFTLVLVPLLQLALGLLLLNRPWMVADRFAPRSAQM